jgi:hypothetical protein
MVLAGVELVPCRYSVEDASLTITCRPAAIETAKLDVDTLSTVPTTPSAAGPERALDPLLPDIPCADIAAGKATTAMTAMTVASITMNLVNSLVNIG